MGGGGVSAKYNYMPPLLLRGTMVQKGGYTIEQVWYVHLLEQHGSTVATLMASPLPAIVYAVSKFTSRIAASYDYGSLQGDSQAVNS